MFDGRDKGGLNVSRPGHNCGRKVMAMDAMPFPFSSRNAQHTESRWKASARCLLRRFPSARRPVFVLSLNEKTLRIRVSLSRESLRTGTLSLLPITRVLRSYEFRISIISLRVEKTGKTFVCIGQSISNAAQEAAASNIKIHEASLLQYREKISPPY